MTKDVARVSHLPEANEPDAFTRGAGTALALRPPRRGPGRGRRSLARARSIGELSAESLWVTRPAAGRSRSPSSSIVIFTRQVLVSLLPGNSPGSADIPGFERFLAGEGDRFALAEDDQFSSLPLPLILGGLGLVLVLFRGPDPPPRTA